MHFVERQGCRPDVPTIPPAAAKPAQSTTTQAAAAKPKQAANNLLPTGPDPPARMPSNRVDVKHTRLLITEITGLERQLRAVSRRHRARPRLLYRLAEAYVALEHVAERNLIEATSKVARNRRANLTRALRYEKEARKATKLINVAGKKAIKHYKTLLRDYPNRCAVDGRSVKKQGCPDEVLYALGYQYERIGQYAEAAATYNRLLRIKPRPRFARRARQRLKGKRMSQRTPRPKGKPSYGPGF